MTSYMDAREIREILEAIRDRMRDHIIDENVVGVPVEQRTHHDVWQQIEESFDVATADLEEIERGVRTHIKPKWFDKCIQAARAYDEYKGLKRNRREEPTVAAVIQSAKEKGLVEGIAPKTDRLFAERVNEDGRSLRGVPVSSANDRKR